MSSVNMDKDFPESNVFVFWTPEEGRSVPVGAERQAFLLPRKPLPVHREDVGDAGPSADAIGRGAYDYLRQFPDCPDNVVYAELLRDAFPHYLADMGAQIVMLENKEVDAPYVRRKLAYLKILLLLEPDSGSLLQRLGMVCYELGLMFVELGHCRSHLLAAMGYLQRSLKLLPGNLTSLNYLGQIDYLLGDYPAAMRSWRAVVDGLDDGSARQALTDRIDRLERQGMPDHPLIDDLEAIGEAMERYGQGNIHEAGMILEKLEEEGTVPAEFPSPEFYYLLGMCRKKGGDAAGAFEAFDKALEQDPDYAPALAGKNRILEGR